MPSVDSTALTQIQSGAFSPAWFVWLDVAGDPVRVTNYGADVTFSSTGDSDLDGNTFVSFGGQFLDIGDVTNSESGSDTLTATLSGIRGLDQALLDAIGDRTKWQGQDGRIWFRVYDEAGANPQGAIVPHYTGKMSSVTLIPSPTSQTIQLTLENYLAAFNDPSNRSYLNQSDYDSGDTSAAATIVASNGSMRGAGNPGGTVPGGIPISSAAGGSGGGSVSAGYGGVGGGSMGDNTYVNLV